LHRRVDRIEGRLEPEFGREVQIRPPIITGQSGRQPTPEEERELGPVEGWITYQRQLRAQEEANAEHLKTHPGGIGNVITIELDIDQEYRARPSHGSEPEAEKTS
jgi:hypothetical protein